MVWRITLIGLIAGVIGTGLGGVISTIFKRKVDKYINFFMGLSGGIMLAVVTFDLIKESMTEIGFPLSVVFIFAGALMTMLIKVNLEHGKGFQSGYLIFLSILLHNLPEGLAIGSSFMATENLGMTLAIVIGIHNIPEVLAMALLTIIAGIPMGIGSFLGAYFGGVFSSLIGVFLAIAAGTMMYVVLEEIFPKTRSMYSIIGFLVGMVIVNYI